MDPYAQQMLEKARQRSKNLGIKTDFNALNELSHNQNFSNLNCTNSIINKAEFCESKLKPYENKASNDSSKNCKKTFTVDKENLGIEINVTSDHRIEMVQIEVQEDNGISKKEVYCSHEEKSKSKIRDCSRNRLKRLGALYSNSDEISSPIHRTENQFCEDDNDLMKSQNKIRKPTKLNKLAELANEIKNWEDQEEIKRTNKVFDDHKTETTKERETTENENTKKLKWDNNVMQSLEAQGFQRRESTSTKLSYEYTEPSNNNCNVKNVIDVSDVQKTFSNITSGKRSDDNQSLMNKNVEQNKLSNNSIKLVYKDPSDLPLKERMKLFEQNRGEAPIPKVPFAMNVPARKVCEEAIKEHIMLKAAHIKSENEKCEKSSNKSEQLSSNIKLVKNAFEVDKGITNNQKPASIQTENDILKTAPKTIQTNLSAIVSQFENNNDNQNKKEKLKISPKRLYPNLNELKSNTETESGTDGNEYTTDALCDDEPLRKSLRKSTDSSMDDQQLSLNISQDSVNLEKAQVRFDLPGYKNDNIFKCKNDEHINNSSDSSINSKTSENSGEISDYLNDAFDDDEDVNDNESVTTNTDSIINAENLETTSNNNMNHVKSQLSVEESKENMVTLVHTVSFYRKQQNNTSNPSTPIRKICREQEVRREITEESETSDSDSLDVEEREIETRLVKEKMTKLRDEVCKQQQIIAQTSQALNLCAATIEFSGSTEAVEGERHLLVATHRRQAALDEIQRLRVEGVIRPSTFPREKGRLTVKEITIPLRQDYIRKLSNDAISGHHLLCLLKYNEIVLATQTVPTLPGLLSVKFPDTLHLNEVYADFRVTLEIYGMTAQREILPHEIKYHININKNKTRTPKKKGSDSRLVMPIVQSPAGPNVVRTPALVQYGFAIFSLREVQRNTWTLTKVSGVSPLEGTVNMKINCELSVSIGYKGFLTMFEDISGFGAWHRRWCYLNGHILNYWKYPDDEKKCTPIGSIDLNMAITQKVTTAPREICARLNTIMLECRTSCKEDSRKSSLMTVKKENMTILRYLLSADTKEERDQWCAYLNKALMLLRAWSSVEKNDKES